MLFQEVIGQQKAKEKLLASLKGGRISHAQLFAGNTGYGSFALALSFARYILCTGNKDKDSCGECPSCKHMSKLIHSDLHFVFPVVKKGKNPLSDEFMGEWRNLMRNGPYFDLADWYEAMGVEDNVQAAIYTDESASLLRKLNLKSYESEYKIVLIWLPEKMNVECSNKLLKILEEPYDKTFFLLVSENPEQLIGTIQSRTQRINIPPLFKEEIQEKLIKDKGLEKSRAEEYARISGGNWHKALRLLQESDEQIYNQEKFVQLMRLCWERKMLPVNEWVSGLTSQGRERQKSFLAHGVRMIRENFISNFGQGEMVYMTDREKEFSRKFSPYIHEGNVIPLINEFEKAYFDISRNGNGKIIFTDFCIKIMQNIRP